VAHAEDVVTAVEGEPQRGADAVFIRERARPVHDGEAEALLARGRGWGRARTIVRRMRRLAPNPRPRRAIDPA